MPLEIAGFVALALNAGASVSPIPARTLPQLNLVPTLELAGPSPQLFLQASASPPPADEPPFSRGWLIAGVAGGAVTGGLFGAAIGTRWCAKQPGNIGNAVIVSSLYVGLGTLFGYKAAEGHQWGKTTTILMDTVGPALGGLMLGFAHLGCG